MCPSQASTGSSELSPLPTRPRQRAADGTPCSRAAKAPRLSSAPQPQSALTDSHATPCAAASAPASHPMQPSTAERFTVQRHPNPLAAVSLSTCITQPSGTQPGAQRTQQSLASVAPPVRRVSRLARVQPRSQPLAAVQPCASSADASHENCCGNASPGRAPVGPPVHAVIPVQHADHAGALLHRASAPLCNQPHAQAATASPSRSNQPHSAGGKCSTHVRYMAPAPITAHPSAPASRPQLSAWPMPYVGPAAPPLNSPACATAPATSPSAEPVAQVTYPVCATDASPCESAPAAQAAATDCARTGQPQAQLCATSGPAVRSNSAASPRVRSPCPGEAEAHRMPALAACSAAPAPTAAANMQQSSLCDLRSLSAGVCDASAPPHPVTLVQARCQSAAGVHVLAAACAPPQAAHASSVAASSMHTQEASALEHARSCQGSTVQPMQAAFQHTQYAPAPRWPAEAQPPQVLPEADEHATHFALRRWPADEERFAGALDAVGAGCCAALARAQRLTAALALRASASELLEAGVASADVPLLRDVASTLCADAGALSESERFLLSAPQHDQSCGAGRVYTGPATDLRASRPAGAESTPVRPPRASAAMPPLPIAAPPQRKRQAILVRARPKSCSQTLYACG